MTPPMTDEAAALQIQQIKHLVDRFLSWRLPQDFAPDAGISYTRPNYHPSVDAMPTGTNLLDAEQAEGMVRHMLEGMPTPPVSRDAGVLVEALEYINRISSDVASARHTAETALAAFSRRSDGGEEGIDEEIWRKPPPHFKADPRWQRQPQSTEEWDAHQDPKASVPFGPSAGLRSRVT